MKIIVLFIACAFLFNCNGDVVTPLEGRYEFRRPENFPAPLYTFDNNPTTQQGFELGRALFYDPVLSSDSSIACANCHQQARSFTDPVHRFSKGVNDKSGFRNAPAIQNMAFQDHFFWDGGVSHLDFTPINAITSEIEMNEKLEEVIIKLQRSNLYGKKFARAFGPGEISSQKLLFALSQFMNLMISADSRYDRYMRNEGIPLTRDELSGLALFEQNCGACHATALFSDGTFRNNGLDKEFENDPGRSRITEFQEDLGKFKVPSLRNVELTSPYMHDGRFKTLEEVLNHYAESVIDSETLDPFLKQGNSPGIPMTENERASIIAFLKTLSDKDFITDKRFANPFIN